MGILVNAEIVADTLMELQEAGKRRSECVVLWLGRRITTHVEVTQVWKPVQKADWGYFWIPESSMNTLMQELRKKRLMVVAQVHSHPRLAFHSAADDKWAIVRHVGALSLVVPYFGRRTSKETFEKDAAAFVLSEENEWLEVHQDHAANIYKIRP